MGLFSTAVTEEGFRYQFKTGFDWEMDEYRLGTPVPYRKNPDLALDIRWEDQVCDGSLESSGGEYPNAPRSVWVVIKDHKVSEIRPFSDQGWADYEKIKAEFGIVDPVLADWDATAQGRYHLVQQRYHRRGAPWECMMVRKYGRDWKNKPNAYMLRTLNTEGFARKILPPKSTSPVESVPPVPTQPAP